MASLKNIKAKIYSYKKTGTVTHAMEAVSAVKMRKAQERALGTRTYAATALSILERLAETVDLAKHPLMNAQSGDTCIVVITSDKGLAGALNTGVIKQVERYIREHDLSIGSVRVVAIGKRGAEYFSARGYTILARRDNIGDSVSENDIREIVNNILDAHKALAIGSVIVAYTNFISTFEQEPLVRQVIPITRETIRAMVSGIRPARGKYAPNLVEFSDAKKSMSYKVEPHAEAVFAALLPQLISIAVFHSMLESKASEHSARMVAMKSATDKAKDMAKSLTRVFNKVRQSAITREVSEITSGMEAMK